MLMQICLLGLFPEQGYDLAEFTEKVPNLEKWINGEKKPTVKQLEAFSKKVHLPFGYLFLSEPPVEKFRFLFLEQMGTKQKKLVLMYTILFC